MSDTFTGLSFIDDLLKGKWIEGLLLFTLFTRNVLAPITLTSMAWSHLFSSPFSSLAFFPNQSLISPCTMSLQAVRAVWSTTGGCRHIFSLGSVIIWIFYCWMWCWRLAWGESNIFFFAIKFLGGDSTAASFSEHCLPEWPEVLERRTQALRDLSTSKLDASFYRFFIHF